jgi:hypothetical protein
MTIQHVSCDETLAAPEMLACIQQLTPRRFVIVTNYQETYRLSAYLRRHSTEPVRFIMRVAAVRKTLHDYFLTGSTGNAAGRPLLFEYLRASGRVVALEQAF